MSEPMDLTGYRWDPVHITEPADDVFHGMYMYGYGPGRDERDGPDVTLQVWDERGARDHAVAEWIADVLGKADNRRTT